MSDTPSAAQSLYPDLPSTGDPAPALRSSPLSPAAQALYGDSKAARPVDGKSPLGGEAKPGTLLGEPPPPANRPDPAGQRPPGTVRFDPAKLQLPEGTQPNPELVGKFAEIAGAARLDQASANKLVGLHLEAQTQAHNRLVGGWANDTRRELGPELPAMVTTIKGTLDIAPEVTELLNWSGLGDHPAVVRQFHQWAVELDRARRGRW